MTDASGPPLIFDRISVRGRRARALARGMPDFLQEGIGTEIADRLAAILREFSVMLVHRSSPGLLLATLAGARPTTRVIASDIVIDTATNLVLDEERLPFAPESLDAVIWILGLEQLNDIPGTLIQIRRALRPDGLFLAAAISGGSLYELRESLLSAESELAEGASPRVAPFPDIRDWGMLMQRAGFALPVVDTDRLTVRYGDALALMRDLRALGLSNALAARGRRMTSPSLLARAAAHYALHFADTDKRVRATFEIAYLTGWAPHESQQKPLKPGSAQQRLADALQTKELTLRSSD